MKLWDHQTIQVLASAGHICQTIEQESPKTRRNVLNPSVFSSRKQCFWPRQGSALHSTKQETKQHSLTFTIVVPQVDRNGFRYCTLLVGIYSWDLYGC